MVLGGRPPGRVGRRRISLEERLPSGRRSSSFSPAGRVAVGPVASTVMSAGRPPRPPRRPDGRVGAGRSSGTARIAPGGKSRGQRPPGGQRSSGGKARSSGARGARREGARRPERPLTAAERRAAEVNAKRAPRPPSATRTPSGRRSRPARSSSGSTRARCAPRRRARRSRAAAPARTTRRIKGVPARGGGRRSPRRPATAGGPPCSPSASATPRRRWSGSASTRPGASPPHCCGSCRASPPCTR